MMQTLQLRSPSFSILESWNMNILHALLLGIFLSGAQLLQAQYEHEWSVFTGIANYQGDLPEPHLELIESRMAGGLIYRFHWHHQWSLRGQIIAGQISGDDKHAKSRSERKFRFSATLLESAVTVEWKPMGRQSHYYVGKFHPHLSPYIFAGLGMTYARPHVLCYREDLPEETDPFAREMNQNWFLALPVGLGLRYDASPEWSVGIEVGQRPVFSDLLDGVSQSGNPKKDDWYIFSGITVSWLIGTRHFRDMNAVL